MPQHEKGSKYILIRESKGVSKGTVVYLIRYELIHWFSPNKEGDFWDNDCISLELDDLKKYIPKNIIGGNIL